MGKEGEASAPSSLLTWGPCPALSLFVGDMHSAQDQLVRTETGSTTWDHAAALAKKRRAATPAPKGAQGWGGPRQRPVCVATGAGRCVGSKWGCR